MSIGSEESSLTVANHTQHYLHIFIEGEAFPYVAPEHSVSHLSEPKPSVLVTVLYAPGQGISGSAVDTVEVPYRGATEACSCEGDDQWGDCVYTPASGGSTRLEIWPEDLEPAE